MAFQERLQESNKNNHGPRDSHKNLAEPMEAHKTTDEKIPAGMMPNPERTGHSTDANPLKATTWRGCWDSDGRWRGLGFLLSGERWTQWPPAHWLDTFIESSGGYTLNFLLKELCFYNNKFSVFIFFLFNTTNTTLKYETIRPLLNSNY